MGHNKQTSDKQERLMDGSLVIKDERLKPCPFCGSEACLTYEGEEDTPDPFSEDWQVACWHCGASPISDSEDKERVIKTWNGRVNS